MSTTGKSEYARVLGPYHSPNRVHTKMWPAGSAHCGCPPSWIFKNSKLLRTIPCGGQYVSLCQISSKSVTLLRRHGNLTVFFKMAAVRHLDLLGAYWDHPRWPLDGLHRCAKFDRNRCMSFDNMKLSIFCPFGLRTPIHAPKIGVFGGFDPQNGDQCQRNPQKEHLRVETVLAVH